MHLWNLLLNKPIIKVLNVLLQNEEILNVIALHTFAPKKPPPKFRSQIPFCLFSSIKENTRVWWKMMEKIAPKSFSIRNKKRKQKLTKTELPYLPYTTEDTLYNVSSVPYTSTTSFNKQIITFVISSANVQNLSKQRNRVGSILFHQTVTM